MVSILPSARTGMDVLGQYLGQGITNAMPQMYENQKRQMGLNAIDKLQAALSPQNGQPVDRGTVLAELARMQTLNPGFERSPYADYVMKEAAARAAQNVPIPNADNSGKRLHEPLPPSPQRREDINFLGRKDDKASLFPTNRVPKTGVGNAAQEATSGVKLPVKTPVEIANEAPEFAKKSTANANPMTPMEAYDYLTKQNQDVIAHNQRIDAEKNARVADQQKYGKIGMEKLAHVYKGDSPQLESYFARKGEEYSKDLKSEADIHAHLAKDAEKIGNYIKNVTSSPTASRSYNRIARMANGTYRQFDDAAEDMRKHIKPLTDLGLFDLARELVQGRNYYPEETDIIVKPLNMGAESAFNALPKIGTSTAGHFSLTPEMFGANIDLEPLKEALRNAKAADPDFSLVLGRKIAMDDKGYSWKNYKDAFNELVNEGFELSDDQSIHMRDLDSPPTSALERMLFDLGLRGK